MKKLLIQLICLFLLSNYLIKTNKVRAFIPYYYLPSNENLEKQSLLIGKNAYQLLYFGQNKDSLNLAKLAIKIYKKDAKLWLILSEAQIANNLYEDALISLTKAQKINPTLSEIYFTKSTIFLKQSRLDEAKKTLETGLKITPENPDAIFQLGNIYLMKGNYLKSIETFDRAIKIKPKFWQALNNKGLAYFDLDKINLSIKYFEKAIEIEKNAEPLLGLATCLSTTDLDLALKLAKTALMEDPNYVEYNYRKEQLWGNKIQVAAEKLLNNNQLKHDIEKAKLKINKLPK